MEIGQDDRKVPQGTGRRIIGQVAGHEIHFEIEDVLDKKPVTLKLRFYLLGLKHSVTKVAIPSPYLRDVIYEQPLLYYLSCL